MSASLIIGLSLRTVRRWKLASVEVDVRTTRIQKPLNSLTKALRERILNIANSVECGQLLP